MKYEVPQDRTFITTDYMRKKYGKYDPNVFKRWVEQGKVEKVRNGVYRNVELDLNSDWDRYMVANNLRHPSYVSLHSALYFYNLIPEYVFDITSVSTKKTQVFSFRGAHYTFQQLKPELFFGYHSFAWKGGQIRMALLEKAILDFAYLEPRFHDAAWLEEMRFDEHVLKDEVNWNLLTSFAKNIDSTGMLMKIETLRKTYQS